MRFVLTVCLVTLSSIIFSQHKDAYKIFSSEGKEISYEKMVKGISKSDLIFFGEVHNDPISHWLELQLTKNLYGLNSHFVLAMEMFEADDQIVMDEYLQGMIEERQLLSEAKIWDNYHTDYKPLVDFAREKKLRMIASNIPRRYANMVYRKGLGVLDSLSQVSRKYIAPLPIVFNIELSSYKKMMTEMAGHDGGNGQNLARSQAVKDATMAYFILQHVQPGHIVFHINGAYHSQDGEGIVWYVKQSKPEIRISTIHVAQQADIEKLDVENRGKGDFIICVPSDMTKTH